MLSRVDDFPHGDLALHTQLRSQPGYDHRVHVWQFLQAFESRAVPYVLGVSPEYHISMSYEIVQLKNHHNRKKIFLFFK